MTIECHRIGLKNVANKKREEFEFKNQTTVCQPNQLHGPILQPSLEIKIKIELAWRAIQLINKYNNKQFQVPSRKSKINIKNKRNKSLLIDFIGKTYMKCY